MGGLIYPLQIGEAGDGGLNASARLSPPTSHMGISSSLVDISAWDVDDVEDVDDEVIDSLDLWNFALG